MGEQQHQLLSNAFAPAPTGQLLLPQGLDLQLVHVLLDPR
jgi:hypothetical protein